MTDGEKYLQAVSNFKGTNQAEQIRITFEAQAAFTSAWETNAQKVADDKKALTFLLDNAILKI